MRLLAAFLSALTTIFNILLITFLLWFAVDQLVRIYIPQLTNFPSEQENQKIRMPFPYIEFKGRPFAQSHDQYGYRWANMPLEPDALHIAFFGGSTGYAGDPPIASLLQRELSATLKTKVQVANFSIVSSNHRQHLHNLLETRDLFQPDIVIFYGGFNETIQSANEDPRAGYPFNFYFTHETPEWKKLLMHSPTFYFLNSQGYINLTDLQMLRKKSPPYSPAWNQAIQDSYFETLDLAKHVTNAFASPKCGGKSEFVFFYQPYQVPKPFLEAHNALRQKIVTLPYGYDVSDAYNGLEHPYTDVVHVVQKANEIMAHTMAKKMLATPALAPCFR